MKGESGINVDGAPVPPTSMLAVLGHRSEKLQACAEDSCWAPSDRLWDMGAPPVTISHIWDLHCEG